MKIEQVLITPKKAKELLLLNTKNRTIKQNKVNDYANDMINGRWRSSTGESIKITKSGFLADGQHRLLAVIKINNPIKFLVISELEDDVMDVIDTGVKRTSGDILGIKGIKNASGVSGIISVYTSHVEGIGNNAYFKRPSPVSILGIYNERPEYWQSIFLMSQDYYRSSSRLMQPSLIGGFYSFLSEIDKDSVKPFFDQIFTEGVVRTKSVSLFVKRLRDDAFSSSKLRLHIKNALFIKTWNSFRTKTDLGVLKYNPDVESFPIPI